MEVLELLQRPSDWTLSGSIGLGVHEPVLIRIEMSRDAALGGFPAEFLVERGNQFADTESAMTLERGSDHVDAPEATISNRFASSWMRGYGVSLAADLLSHPPGLALQRRCIAMGPRILGRGR
jgi:hypothetical protein